MSPSAQRLYYNSNWCIEFAIEFRAAKNALRRPSIGAPLAIIIIDAQVLASDICASIEKIIALKKALPQNKKIGHGPVQSQALVQAMAWSS